MSRQYASQLLFEVKASKIYQNIVFICVLISLISIFLISLDNILLSVFIFSFLIFLVFYSVKKNINCNLQWQADGGWLIRLDNDVLKAQLKAGSVVTPVFSRLKFVLDDNKNFTVILFKDSIDIEKFRQLRVRIKVEGLKKNERDTLS